METQSSHVVKRKSTEDSRSKSKPASSVEKGSTPTSKVAIAGGNDRLAISHRQLVRREGKAKVGLREGGNSGAKEGGKDSSSVRGDTNRKKSGFVEIDR
jgi:hypothetical protein